MLTDEQIQWAEHTTAYDLPMHVLIGLLISRLKNTNGLMYVEPSQIDLCIMLLKSKPE